MRTGGPPPSWAPRVTEVFGEASRVHARLQAADPTPIVAAAALMRETASRGGRILVFGNGGSAAQAQHFAAELVGRFVTERPALAAIALTADGSTLTAVGNDYGFERVFARQVDALGRAGDVAFGLTTSGASPNVVAALVTARDRGMSTVALTGRDGGPVASLVDVHVNVPDLSTARVQEAHLTVLHILCELIERDLQLHASVEDTPHAR